MSLLKREEWQHLVRDVAWTLSYVDDEAVYPEWLSGTGKVPREAWVTWEEDYKVSYPDYVSTQREKEASAYAVTGFARDMLAVRDHLERALSHVPPGALADEKIKSFVDGIESTLRELDAVFARQGIVRVESVGQALDPHKHQAMIEIATDGADAGTIVEEMQSGYMLKDRLLRPALVAVAKAG